eukprot:GGOE01021419.1.p1 GENE.GGOE01021419.1~~GGOE01021419.1.p1  ORF type:complete len:620 (-),score=156.50 GGOE01021419.1:376-2235(-)
MDIRVAHPTGGSLTWPIFPYRAPPRQTPKLKPKKVAEPVSSIIVQVHCWLLGAHPTIAVTLDTTSTVDEAKEAVWYRYQSEIAERTMYCPNLARNQNVDDYLLVPALENGQPDFVSPSLRSHWPLSKQLTFPFIVVFVESRTAQLQNKELLRRQELESRELLELEDACRSTMEGIYLASMRATIQAIQDFVTAYHQWQWESEEQFRAAVWDMEEEAEGTMLGMSLEAAVSIEGIARAGVHNSFHVERRQLSQQAMQDVGSIEAQEQMKALLAMLQQRWEEWLRRGPDIERLIHRHQLEKGLLFDMTCEHLGLGPKLAPPPPPPPPPKETKYQLVVCCNLPGAPLALEFTLDIATTGAAVLQSFWDHVLDSNDGVAPRSWPSRYIRDFTLKPPGDDEDAVVLGLPLHNQLDAPHEVEVVEALSLLKRQETWDRRTATLGRIRTDMCRAEEAHRQRQLACLAQEVQIRNALERWEVEDFYNVTRPFAHKLQRLQEELRRKQTGSRQSSRHGRTSTPSSPSTPETPPCRGLPVLRAKVMELLEGHEAALQHAMDAAEAYCQAQRFLLLSQRPRQEDDRVNKGLMSPLHYRGPRSLPPPHTVPDVLKLQSSQQQPPWYTASTL